MDSFDLKCESVTCIIYMLCNYNIYFYYIGLYQLPVTNLVQPQSDLRLIRKLDTTFLKNLKKRIKDDPSGPGVPPVAVLCIDVQQKEDFSERLKESYKYEVLGGQHTTAAKAELYHDNPNNLCTIKCLLKFM